MKISDPKKLTLKGIKNIIFDWGGVITDIDFKIMSESFHRLGVADFEQFFTRTEAKPFMKDFETNDISVSDFRDEIRKHSTQEISDEQIDAAWNSILQDTPIKRIDTIKRLASKYRLFLLSNTNALHTKYFNEKLKKEQGVNHFDLFEKVFYSQEVGIRKPDIGIFEFAIREGKLVPEETLFIDDIEIQVDAAASLGINAFHLEIEKTDIVELFKAW